MKLEIFRQLADAFVEGVALARLDGGIFYANDTLRKMLGVAAEQDVAALSLYDFCSSANAVRLREQAIATLLREGSWTGRIGLRSGAGEPCGTARQLIRIPGEDGSPHSLAMIAENALGDRDNRKQLSRLTHDLRAPLNAILGFAQLLELDGDALSSDQRDNVCQILIGARGLLRMIDELRDPAGGGADGTVLSREAAAVTPNAEGAGQNPEPGRLFAATGTLLYVDDDEGSRALMSAVLRDTPYRLMTAASGEEALDLLRSSFEATPDLVFLDINLPGMNAFDVLSRLRLDPALAHVPVVAMSAGASTEQIDRAREAGFFRFVEKPVMWEALEEVLPGGLPGLDWWVGKR